MHKRGFQNRWQNKHWCFTPSAYQRGQTDSNVESTGSSPNYFSMSSKGRGWYEDDEGDTYDMERIYVSAPLIDDLGVYRIGVLYHRNSYTSANCSAYTFIAECDDNGRIRSYGSSNYTSLDHKVFAGYHARGWCINIKSGLVWNDVVGTIPLITIDGINLTVGGKAHEIYKTVKSKTTDNFFFISFTLTDCTEEVENIGAALDVSDTTPEPNDICTRMETFKGDWVYWYGGSGEIASESVLQRLAASYPKYYPATYIANCRKDINGHTRIADCSYAVSYAYNIGRTDSTWFMQNYATWNGAPKNGMFLVRTGHVAIYRDGHTMEMSGQAYDYQERPYVASAWSRVGYDPNREY